MSKIEYVPEVWLVCPECKIEKPRFMFSELLSEDQPLCIGCALRATLRSTKNVERMKVQCECGGYRVVGEKCRYHWERNGL